jgi:hypothetical protein
MKHVVLKCPCGYGDHQDADRQKSATEKAGLRVHGRP